ncbi:MAG: Smt3-specific protease, partial [Piccolia ochrophora]
LLDAPPAPHTPPAPVAASSPPAVSSSPPAVSSSPAAPSPPAAPLPQLIDLDEGQNGRRLPSVPVIRALDQEWDDKVDTALRAAPSKELAMTTDGQELRRRDFETVVPRGNGVADGWVNDEIINAYLQALTRYGNEKTRTHSRNKGVVPRYAAFTTFFYSRLAEKGVEGLQRWAARLKIEGKKLLEVEHLFIPVHLGVHWTLAVVSGKTRTIEYFDSLGGPHGRHTTLIRGWVASELKDAFVDAEWTTLDAQSPRQGNSRDCGVFAITTAKMIMMDVDPMAVRPGDIPLQRRRVVAELLNGGFVGGFALDSQADGLRAAEEEEEEGDDTYVEGEDSSEDKDSSDSDGGSDDRCVSEEEFAVRYQTDEEEPALGSSSSGIDDEGEEEEEEEEDEVEEEEGEDEEEGEGAVDGDGIGDFVLGAEHYGDDLEDYEAWDAEADLEL